MADDRTDIKISRSNGNGKGGRISYFIRPAAECLNRSRKVSGWPGNDIQEKIDKCVSKWFSPMVILYEIEGSVVGSNSKENALKEYWRRCEKEDINKQFEVKLLQP